MDARWVASGVALLLLAGCGQGTGTGEAKGKALLRVNEAEIGVAEFQRELDRLPPSLQPAVASKEGQRRFLDDLTKRELLLQEAHRRKIDARQELVDKANDFRRRLIVEALLAEERQKIQVPEEEVRAYFAAHPEEFSTDQVRVKHILVRTAAEAQAVAARLAQQERFEDLARELSLDKESGAKGGDLERPMGFGDMPLEFARAAFALKPGQVSGVVQTRIGHHVIKLVERRKGSPLPYEQVRERVRQRLVGERQRKALEDLLAALQSGATVKVEEDLLPVQRPGGAPPPPGAPGAGPGEQK